MKKIILIGAGGHSKSCIEVINQTKKYKIEFILDKESEGIFLGYKKIKYNKEILAKLQKKIKYACICFGQIKNKIAREKTFEDLRDIGFQFPSIKSKSAYISKTSQVLGGTIVMNGCVINIDVKIGYNNIINTGSIIEHDVSIGNHDHIAPGVIINGGAEIGNNCFIGSGSIIKQGIKIKSNSFIQAGKIILK